MLAWPVAVWRWQDPVTAIYTEVEQRSLERAYDRRLAALAHPDLAQADRAAVKEPVAVPAAAAAYRKSLSTGDVVGRLRIPRLGLDAMIVEGTDTRTLRRGPGRYRKLFLPGEGELVYIAGHRTTYSAPFSRIDELRHGDRVVVDMPYARFTYRIVRHRIVRENDLSVLRSPGKELLALQACHPRFFATHRYIAYAAPVAVQPRPDDAPAADAAP